MTRRATTGAVRLAFVALLLVSVPAAHAGPEECTEYTEVGPLPTAGVAVERTTCTGEAWTIAVSDPNGRSELRWYDDERGVGLELYRPPRFVAWWDNAEGCELIVYAFGAEDVGCVAGPPPSPTLLP